MKIKNVKRLYLDLKCKLAKYIAYSVISHIQGLDGGLEEAQTPKNQKKHAKKPSVIRTVFYGGEFRAPI